MFPLSVFSSARTGSTDSAGFHPAQPPVPPGAWQADFLYEKDLQSWLADGRLTGLQTAFSRGSDRAYVQDKLKADAAKVRTLLEQGAQVLVCGGRNMAADVAVAMDEILAPLSLSVAGLKASGRYLEDTY